MPLDPRRVKALFQSALDLTDPAARVAFLDRECAADTELRRRLDDLLRDAERPSPLLEGPLAAAATRADFVLGSAPAGAPDATVGLSDHGGTLGTTGVDPAGGTVGFSDVGGTKPAPQPAEAVIGTLVAGRYKVRQAIGEGGMGTVYFAEQIQPVRRQVALKLIRAGMDSRQVLARFESERQALALMDHPNIARVLDAGTTESGRPFFVMELVKGIPLTDFCDQHRLDLPTRLNLFRQICSAVQHAHQKGIIHRDLKPTNILVEDHAGTPVPKVIDFGLAKATSGLSLTEASLFTAFGTIAGTPLYMAPEQATFNSLDVDTRADIYSLGVILYELLTGTTPIRKESLQRAALDEVMRVIREEEAQVPSHRISTSEALPSVAATRQVEPIRLGRLVRGDLDWIVMKALAKDRSRRYDSAIGLANDVERFLHDEPVTAGPPTARYRTAKFIRRHRGQVIAASLVVLALIGGTVGTTLGLIEARRQRDLSRAETAAKERARAAEVDQRHKAEAAQQAEARSRQTAERRSDQLGKVNEILGSIFRDLDLNQAEKEGKPVAAAIGERLDQASVALEGESIGDPLTVARMQMTLGQAQSSLGYYKKAIDLLERSRATLLQRLGPNDRTTLSCIVPLAWSIEMDGQQDRAIAMLEPAIAVMKLQLGPDDLVTLGSMNNLAFAYLDAGRLDGSIALFEQVLEARRAKLGPDHRDTLDSMDGLALACQFAGRIDRAIPLHEQALASCQARLGPDHPSTLMAMSNLAIDYLVSGQFDRCIALNELTVAGRRAKLGPDNGYTTVSLGNLGTAYHADGQIERAIPLLEQSLQVHKAKYGPDHPDTLVGDHYLAIAYRDAGQFHRALPLLDHTYAALKAALGPKHYRTLKCLNSLATTYRVAGSCDRAIPLHEQAIEADRATLGPDHPQTLTAMAQLARDYSAAGRYDRAIPLFQQALAGRRFKLGPDHPDNLMDMTDLARAHAGAGAVDKAIALDRECLETHRRLNRPNPWAMADAQSWAGSRLLGREAWAEAEPMLRASLSLLQSNGPDHWRTFDTRSLLGGALLGQGKPDEARPLLIAGFEGMKQNLAKIPAPDWGEPIAAADRLIRLAEATSKPDDAKRWREEKARIEAQFKPTVLVGMTPQSEPAKPTATVPVESMPVPTPTPAGGKP